ncbi:MAG: MarR family transcriptional regulator [Balneolales bacterium]|nr:MarR family transcriptional regulator [Balneolales bacterium]
MLEEEVYLSRFRNDYHKGIINFIYTYGIINTRLQQLFSEYDITTQQFNILRILRGSYPEACTNSYIKERMLDKNSDVTRIVNRLINIGFVSRCSSKEDKRKVEIRIEEKGLELLSKMDNLSSREDELLGNLSDEEIRLFNTLLDKIRKPK